MTTIPDFEITEVILSDGRKTVCRAVRRKDGSPVVCKLISGEFYDPTETVKLRREYELTQKLNFYGVPKVLEFNEFSGGAAIVMEDFGGKALIGYVNNNPMALQQFLSV
ncbi:MAG TPA: hypothetical protein PK228_19225, partial [Saprospiraceae bacterium]|nr:hypothetical protein [Saprospiraceae bacterium]